MSKHDKAGNPGRGKVERDAGWGDLTEAARVLERELRRFEELTTAARRMPLHTQKAIERAAKATAGTAAEQELVDLALGALVRAMTAVRERHEKNAAALQARGEEIRRRADEYGSLLERYAALGEEGRILNELVQEAAASQRGTTTPEGLRAFAAALGGLEERMAALVDGARAFGQAAGAAGMTDLAEQADALRQQVSAARNKMTLVRRSLDVPPPEPSELN